MALWEIGMEMEIARFEATAIELDSNDAAAEAEMLADDDDLPF